ncbi:MAG: amidohydrolase [Bacillota bacterium]
MDKESLKREAVAAIDRRAGEIIELGETIFAEPELGYKETKTAARVEEKFGELGIKYRSGLAVTGIRGDLPGRQSGLRVAVMGELDAVVCHDHPSADPQTGAAHACGHNAQIAAMVGVAMGLVDAGIMEHLDGDVALFALPAEEYVEIEFRQKLRREGTIDFLGGKQELIRLGEFDDIDLAMMIHSEPNLPERKARVGGTSNGFMGKGIQYVGREAHAGGAPHEGINALSAAVLGLVGIALNRETFRDEDSIRIHPIITKGGDLVNIIPADVRIETYVRGRSMEAIIEASKKANNALRGGAMAIGAEVKIDEIPGYLPLLQNEELSNLFGENIASLIGRGNVLPGGHMAGSTDMGDITHLMPGIHPSIGGMVGRAHARDYKMVDPEMAYVIPAKAMAMTVIDLLYDNGKGGKNIKQKYPAKMSKADYLKMWEDLLKS